MFQRYLSSVFNKLALRFSFFQFQALLERPVANLEEALERAELLNSFISSFIAAATPIVRTVVEEEHLPPEKRTIKPTNIGMGPKITS